MSKPTATTLIVASLKAGREVKLSQRDYLVISQYAENMGMKLDIVKKDGMELTVKIKTMAKISSTELNEFLKAHKACVNVSDENRYSLDYNGTICVTIVNDSSDGIEATIYPVKMEDDIGNGAGGSVIKKFSKD